MLNVSGMYAKASKENSKMVIIIVLLPYASCLSNSSSVSIFLSFAKPRGNAEYATYS
jgi:hypothetical protein